MNGYVLVNILGALLIVTSLSVMLTRSPRTSAFEYAAQSCVLVAIFITLGMTTGSTELFTWSFTATLTKVIFVPAVVLYAYKKMGAPENTEGSSTTPVLSIVLVAIELLVCFIAVMGIQLPTAAEVKPALAVSLAHFFIGLTCIITQRNILKQMFGYCLMENGSHVTLALLAPQAPELVEVGIATDATMRMYEVTKYAVELNHCMTANMFLMSNKAYDQLTEEERGWFMEGCKLAEKVAYDTVVSGDAAAYELYAKEGVEIIRHDELDPEALAEFKSVTSSVWDKYRALIGEELFGVFEEGLAAIKK